jgi:hypothetical protein
MHTSSFSPLSGAHILVCVVALHPQPATITTDLPGRMVAYRIVT